MRPAAPTQSGPPASTQALRALLQGRRPTVAVYLDYITPFSGMYEERIRSLFHARCRELDLDLMLVYGRELRATHALTRQHNKIFELARAPRVDAVAIVSTLLSTHGATAVAELAQQCSGMPLCSLGIALPGVPSVTVDDRAGLSAAIEHLICDHGRRRIAFLSGPEANPEAESRLQTYREVLQQHGLLDPELIGCGDFLRSGGQRATQRLLAQNGVPDAVVAASDAMALGAVEALHAHGHRVPRDVAVTGFDNLRAAAASNPSLATVAQPFAALVEAALSMLLSQLAGQTTPELIRLPTEFIPRRSCGCAGPARKAVFASAPAATGDALSHLLERTDELQEALAERLCSGSDDGRASAARLLGALELQLRGEADAFLTTLDGLLQSIEDDTDRYSALQDAVTRLRAEFHDFGATLEDLWHEARVRIALASSSNDLRQRFALESMNIRVLQVGERLFSALDLGTLTNTLPEALTSVGIPTAFVSRYPCEDKNELELLLCMIDGQPHTTCEQRFADRLFYPDCAARATSRRSYLVFPLVSETRPLGVLVLEYTPGAEVYGVLRDQLTASLRSIELNREVMEKTLLHERSVQERLATTRRMQALSVLAGSVAHDLNNSLGPLAALPEIVLHEIDQLPVQPAATANLRADLELMKSATLRAVQTIKDLLTLSRQGKAAQKSLDLNRTVQSCFGDNSIRLIATDGVRVEMDLAPVPLIVRAAEAQLARAMTNLVRNALEATGPSGRVTIRTFAVRLTEALSGYELVEPGDYVAVAVSDDGTGIPEADLAHIFEPFFSKKRAGESSGTGLGLAITHAVVKEHHGFVNVVSTIGEGTTFTLYLPHADGTAQPSERPRVRAGRARVLIVDDEAVQLRTGKRLLTHLGYAVDTLGSGRHAYERFVQAAAAGENPYDIVLLDMLLNGEHDGIHLLEQIRSLFPTQKAILVSGHAPPERVRLAAEKGLLWLAKPYTLEALAHAVDSALYDGGRRSLPAPARPSQPSPSA